MSWILLAGVAATALLGWWWADSVGALVSRDRALLVSMRPISIVKCKMESVGFFLYIETIEKYRKNKAGQYSCHISFCAK
jgi:hypothetical protein